ncbi:MAG: hypothetical protein CM15mP8_3920 [Methanobacteriota archaeon]|nr:MAG: hypothetical protein CM15mP8_3920 [Euryarchaeota archaeon]
MPARYSFNDVNNESDLENVNLDIYCWFCVAMAQGAKAKMFRRKKYHQGAVIEWNLFERLAGRVAIDHYL